MGLFDDAPGVALEFVAALYLVQDAGSRGQSLSLLANKLMAVLKLRLTLNPAQLKVFDAFLDAKLRPADRPVAAAAPIPTVHLSPAAQLAKAKDRLRPKSAPVASLRAGSDR